MATPTTAGLPVAFLPGVHERTVLLISASRVVHDPEIGPRITVDFRVTSGYQTLVVTHDLLPDDVRQLAWLLHGVGTGEVVTNGEEDFAHWQPCTCLALTIDVAEGSDDAYVVLSLPADRALVRGLDSHPEDDTPSIVGLCVSLEALRAAGATLRRALNHLLNDSPDIAEQD